VWKPTSSISCENGSGKARPLPSRNETSVSATEEHHMELRVTESEVKDGVGLVRLNRPGRGNSWTHRMNAEYRWIMQSFENDPTVRVIVVTGAGRQFCVGADFRALEHHQDSKHDYVAAAAELKMATPGEGVHPEFDHELIWHWGLSKPVIAAINGACAGIA